MDDNSTYVKGLRSIIHDIMKLKFVTQSSFHLLIYEIVIIIFFCIILCMWKACINAVSINTYIQKYSPMKHSLCSDLWSLNFVREGQRRFYNLVLYIKNDSRLIHKHMVYLCFLIMKLGEKISSVEHIILSTSYLQRKNSFSQNITTLSFTVKPTCRL